MNASLPRGQRTVQATVEAILSTRRVFEVPKDVVKVKQILVDLANHIRELEADISKLRLQLGSTSADPVSGTSAPTEEDTAIPQTAIHPDVSSIDVRSTRRSERSMSCYGDRPLPNALICRLSRIRNAPPRKI